MTDRDLLELIASQVSHLTTRVDGLTRDMADVKADLAGVKTELTGVKSELAEVKSDLQFTRDVVIRIENDHGLKLGALLNGYKQNAERLVSEPA